MHAYIGEHYPKTRMKKVPRFGYDTLTIMPQMSEEFVLNDA